MKRSGGSPRAAALPANLCLGVAAWFASPALEARAESVEVPASDDHDVEVGAGFDVAARPSTDSRVNYTPSLQWTVHATVPVLGWLVVRTSGGMAYLDAEPEPGALGVAGQPSSTPTLSGPRVTLELVPHLDVAESFELFAAAGAAWQRWTAPAFDVGDPSPLRTSERSGVLVEFPVSVGGRLLLLNRRLGLSLSLGALIAGPQSGALFDSGAGAGQALRQDTGELVRVAAMPKFSSSAFGGLHFDVRF